MLALQPSDCPNGIYRGNIVIRSAEDIVAYTAADVRFLHGNLDVAGDVSFVATRLTGVQGMVMVAGEADVSLPACTYIDLSVHVSQSARVSAACEQVGRGVRCEDDALLALPKCRAIGKTDGVSVLSTGNSRVVAPLCTSYTGDVVIQLGAEFNAPNATRMTNKASAAVMLAVAVARRRKRP